MRAEIAQVLRQQLEERGCFHYLWNISVLLILVSVCIGHGLTGLMMGSLLQTEQNSSVSKNFYRSRLAHELDVGVPPPFVTLIVSRHNRNPVKILEYETNFSSTDQLLSSNECQSSDVENKDNKGDEKHDIHSDSKIKTTDDRPKSKPPESKTDKSSQSSSPHSSLSSKESTSKQKYQQDNDHKTQTEKLTPNQDESHNNKAKKKAEEEKPIPELNLPDFSKYGLNTPDTLNVHNSAGLNSHAGMPKVVRFSGDTGYSKNRNGNYYYSSNYHGWSNLASRDWSNDALRDHSGATGFLVSCDLGMVTFAKSLIQRGADINAVDNFGRNALMRAIYRGQIGVVEWLIYNSTINLKHTTPTLRFNAIDFLTYGPHSHLMDIDTYSRGIRDSILRADADSE